MRDQVFEDLWPVVGIAELERENVLLLGRGKVISKKDLAATPGSYPVYSSAKENDGKFGEYGLYMFDEELITWSVDGGGRLFHRPAHKFSITNVGGWIRILQPEKIFCRYLYFVLSYLHSQVEFDWVRKAHPSVIRTVYKKIPLPPLDEQKRIVAVLDQAFAALDRARAHAEANLADANVLFENFLTSAIANNSPAWELATFDDTNLLRIIDGDRGKNYPNKEDFDSSNDCLFLNTKNVRPDGFEFSELMFISREKDEALSKGKLDKRDVVLTTRGTVGNVGIFDDTVPFDDIRINSGMLILRPNEERLRAEYLIALIRSKAFKDQIAQHVSGAAQPQLPIRSLRQFTLPMPKDVSEQLLIATALDKLEEKCVALMAQYRTTVADIAALRQSLLQKAFSGELT